MQLINQRDNKYIGWTLGNSNTTVYDAGCTSCCCAMALDIPLLDIVNEPKHYVDASGTVVGGSNSDLILWGSFTVKYIYHEKYYNNPADISSLKKYLDEGYRPILETRFNKNEGLMHFVVATSYSGDMINIADPWDGKEKVFNTAYGEPSRWIYGMTVYGTKYFTPTEPPNEALTSCLKDRETMWKQRDEALKQIDILNAIVKQLNTESANKTADIEAYKRQVETLKAGIITKDTQLLTKDNIIEQLNNSLIACQAQKPQDCSAYTIKLKNISDYIQTCHWWVCSVAKIKSLLK